MGNNSSKRTENVKFDTPILLRPDTIKYANLLQRKSYMGFAYNKHGVLMPVSLKIIEPQTIRTQFGSVSNYSPKLLNSNKPKEREKTFEHLNDKENKPFKIHEHEKSSRKLEKGESLDLNNKNEINPIKQYELEKIYKKDIPQRVNNFVYKNGTKPIHFLVQSEKKMRIRQNSTFCPNHNTQINKKETNYNSVDYNTTNSQAGIQNNRTKYQDVIKEEKIFDNFGKTCKSISNVFKNFGQAIISPKKVIKNQKDQNLHKADKKTKDQQPVKLKNFYRNPNYIIFEQTSTKTKRQDIGARLLRMERLLELENEKEIELRKLMKNPFICFKDNYIFIDLKKSNNSKYDFHIVIGKIFELRPCFPSLLKENDYVKIHNIEITDNNCDRVTFNHWNMVGKGILLDIDEENEIIKFEGNISKKIDKDKELIMVLSVSLATFYTLNKNLDDLKNFLSTRPVYKSIFFGLDPKISIPEKNTKMLSTELFEELNKHQKIAVEAALASEYYSVINGPPGTGKTHTLAVIIKELWERNFLEVQKNPNSFNKNFKILVTGFSNEPVNKLLRKLSKMLPKEDLLRLGVLFKISEDLREYFIEEKLPNLNRNYKPKDFYHIIKKHKIIFCTEISLRGKHLQSWIERGNKFSFAIIDEAGQSIEPSTWLPIMLSKRFVLAGDPKQLKPVIHNKCAYELQDTLLDRLALTHKNDGVQVTLKINYRSVPSIVSIFSKLFYGGYVEPFKKNYKEYYPISTFRTFPNHKTKRGLSKGCYLVDTNPSKIFDYERRGINRLGIFNEYEAQILIEWYKRLKRCKGIEEEDIGIISMYRHQMLYIKSKLRNEKCEIATVDSFQGREKNIILISMVRSNSFERVGFLTNKARLNVAFSRAKKLMIVFGDLKTLNSNSKVLQRVFELFKYGIRIEDAEKCKVGGYSIKNYMTKENK